MNLMKADWKIRGIVLMISSIIWPVLGIYLKFFSRLGAISGSNDFLVFMVLAGIISWPARPRVLIYYFIYSEIPIKNKIKKEKSSSPRGLKTLHAFIIRVGGGTMKAQKTHLAVIVIQPKFSFWQIALFRAQGLLDDFYAQFIIYAASLRRNPCRSGIRFAKNPGGFNAGDNCHDG